jgi:hypothetical protein
MGSYLLPENDNCIDCEAALQDGNPIEEDWVAYEHAAVITNKRCVRKINVSRA